MKPPLPITSLVVDCAEIHNTGVWAVHFTDRHGEDVRTYSRENIARGVAGRYEREGRTVHGVYEYTAEEVGTVVGKWRASRSW